MKAAELTSQAAARRYLLKGKKGKEMKSFYIAPFMRIGLLRIVSKRSGMDHTVLPANTPYAFLSFVAFTMGMSPPPTEVTDIQLQLTAHLSTQKG